MTPPSIDIRVGQDGHSIPAALAAFAVVDDEVSYSCSVQLP
jgi:hypothetical protein